MNRMLSILGGLAISAVVFTASADTHLWLTTEGAGIEVSSESNHHAPPPPPHRHHNHKGYCKVCKKNYKKHYKQMKKAAKKHRKEMKKAQKKHHKHH